MAVLGDHFDISGRDQFLERGTLQGVIVDLAPAGRTEEQGLAARQRDPDRFACLVDDAFDGRISPEVEVTG